MLNRQEAQPGRIHILPGANAQVWRAGRHARVLLLRGKGRRRGTSAAQNIWWHRSGWRACFVWHGACFVTRAASNDEPWPDVLGYSPATCTRRLHRPHNQRGWRIPLDFLPHVKKWGTLFGRSLDPTRSSHGICAASGVEDGAQYTRASRAHRARNGAERWGLGVSGRRRYCTAPPPATESTASRAQEPWRPRARNMGHPQRLCDPAKT